MAGLYNHSQYNIKNGKKVQKFSSSIALLNINDLSGIDILKQSLLNEEVYVSLLTAKALIQYYKRTNTTPEKKAKNE